MIAPHQYHDHIKQVFQEHGDPMIAQGQMDYMRRQFEYYGLKAATWMGLSKEIFREHGMYQGDDLRAFVRLCMSDEYREVNYAGLQMLEKQMKKCPKDFIHFYEELILTRSWWDTVDWIRKMVGTHFQRFPELIVPVTEGWMTSGNIWLQRICLIFQLSYQDKTDFELMKAYILRLAGSKEFFIQKGAGWSLRQYSKTNAAAVIQFVAENPQLAPLTKREALKWLRNNG